MKYNYSSEEVKRLKTKDLRTMMNVILNNNEDDLIILENLMKHFNVITAMIHLSTKDKIYVFYTSKF